MSGCCPSTQAHDKSQEHHGHSHGKKGKFDPVMHGSALVMAMGFFAYMLFPQVSWLHHFSYAVIDLMHTMWWGIALGIVFIGLMSRIPREYFTALLGRRDNFTGILRATFAGVLLDLCNHGILMIAAKLYERGVSLPKVMAFLLASPWNSFSLTLILIALVGVKWTAIYILGSAVIAIISGLVYAALVKGRVFAENPNTVDLPDNFSITKDARARLKKFKFDAKFLRSITVDALSESAMLIRWLLLSVVITAAIRTFVPPEVFGEFFGPTFWGLMATLGVATLLEVCSEGTAPLAAEILNKAAAPGNGFTFLMAGVATDYTEMMIIREFSGKWAVALSLPLITVPQILLLGWVMNMAGM